MLSTLIRGRGQIAEKLASWTIPQLLAAAATVPTTIAERLPTGEPPVPESVTSRTMIAAGRSNVPGLFWDRRLGVTSLQAMHEDMQTLLRWNRELKAKLVLAELNAKEQGRLETALQMEVRRRARKGLERRLRLVA